MPNLEDKIYNEQEKYIEEKFGKQEANIANYGWGVDGGETYITVETKVYGHGVLVSQGDLKTGEITHSFTER